MSSFDPFEKLKGEPPVNKYLSSTDAIDKNETSKNTTSSKKAGKERDSVERSKCAESKQVSAKPKKKPEPPSFAEWVKGKKAQTSSTVERPKNSEQPQKKTEPAFAAGRAKESDVPNKKTKPPSFAEQEKNLNNNKKKILPSTVAQLKKKTEPSSRAECENNFEKPKNKNELAGSSARRESVPVLNSLASSKTSNKCRSVSPPKEEQNSSFQTKNLLVRIARTSMEDLKVPKNKNYSKEADKKQKKQSSNVLKKDSNKELKKEPRKEAKKEHNKEPSKERKKEPRKEYKQELNREHKKEHKKEPSKEDQKEPNKEQKKEPSKEQKIEPNKEQYKVLNKEHNKEPNKENNKEPNTEQKKELKKESIKEHKKTQKKTDDNAARKEVASENKIVPIPKKITPTKAQQKAFDNDEPLSKKRKPNEFKLKRLVVRLPKVDIFKLQTEFAAKHKRQPKNLTPPPTIAGQKRRGRPPKRDSPPEKKLKQEFYIKLPNSPQSSRNTRELPGPSAKKKKDKTLKRLAHHGPGKTKPTKFTRTFLMQNYGKRFFNCRVKIEHCKHPLMIIFDSNARARKMQHSNTKSKNLSVSFAEQVEVFGSSESESEGNEFEASTSAAAALQPNPALATPMPARLKKVENGKVVDDIELDPSLFVEFLGSSSSTPLLAPSGHRKREKKSFSPLKGDGISPRAEQLKMANEKISRTALQHMDDEEDDDDDEYIVPIEIPPRRPSQVNSLSDVKAFTKTREAPLAATVSAEPATKVIETCTTDSTEEEITNYTSQNNGTSEPPAVPATTNCLETEPTIVAENSSANNTALTDADPILNNWQATEGKSFPQEPLQNADDESHTKVNFAESPTADIQELQSFITPPKNDSLIANASEVSESFVSDGSIINTSSSTESNYVSIDDTVADVDSPQKTSNSKSNSPTPTLSALNDLLNVVEDVEPEKQSELSDTGACKTSDFDDGGGSNAGDGDGEDDNISLNIFPDGDSTMGNTSLLADDVLNEILN